MINFLNNYDKAFIQISMDELNEKRQTLLTYSTIAIWLFIIILVVVLILIHNLSLRLQNKGTFLTEEESRSILLLVRIVALVAILIELYVSYENLRLVRSTNPEVDELKAATLQHMLAIVAVIGGLIVVYVAVISSRTGDNSTNIVNPEL